MTRQECETALIGLMEAAFKLYREYNPEGTWLDMSIVNGQMCIRDTRTLEDGSPVLSKDVDGKYNQLHSIYVCKFPDGRVADTAFWNKIFEEVG